MTLDSALWSLCATVEDAVRTEDGIAEPRRIIQPRPNNAKQMPTRGIHSAVLLSVTAAVGGVWLHYLSPTSFVAALVAFARHAAQVGFFSWVSLSVALFLAPIIASLLVNAFGKQYAKRGLLLYAIFTPRRLQLILRGVDLQPRAIALINAVMPTPYAFESIRVGSLVLSIGLTLRAIEVTLNAPAVGFRLQPRPIPNPQARQSSLHWCMHGIQCIYSTLHGGC
jgi:hypothetical protein